MAHLSGERARAAVIDLGSMAVRLHVAESLGGGFFGPGNGENSTIAFRTLHTERRILRLAEHLTVGEGLSSKLMEKTLNCLLEFQSTIKNFQVDSSWVRIVCTEALRRAVNGTAFAKKIERETGFSTAILLSEEEARWTAYGVLLATPTLSDPTLIVDLGGGSTEFIWVRDPRPPIDRLKLRYSSEPIGALSLLQRFQLGAPADPTVLSQMETHIQNNLKTALLRVLRDSSQVSSLLATGGTALNLAAIHCNAIPVETHTFFQTTVPRKDLEKIYQRLAFASLEERAGGDFLEQGREDVIVPGLAILKILLLTLGVESITLTHLGLREGILNDLLRRTAKV